MKIIALLLALLCAPLAFQACSTPPDARVAQYQTLRAVGTSAKAGMDAATQLLKQGTITVEKWQKVATFYDTRFQPSFKLAVYAASSDLSSAASPDILRLAAELNTLIMEISK